MVKIAAKTIKTDENTVRHNKQNNKGRRKSKP